MTNKDVSSLEWFLNFLNQRINNLSHGDRLKWITEALCMIQFGSPSGGLFKYQLFPPNIFPNKIQEWDSKNRLEECQKAIDDFLFELMHGIENYISQREDWISGKHFNLQWSFAELDFQATLRVLLPRGIGVERKPANEGKNNKKFLYRINRNDFNKGHFHITLNSHKDEEALLLAFCQNLEDIPIESLRKCPECHNWFLHLSKKKKMFCSNKCAARKGVRSRRQQMKKDDPQAYEKVLAEGSKRARKSYEKKQRKENPKVKIARRPRKHKV